MFCSQKGRPIALEAHVSIIIHFLQVPSNYSIDCRIELPESVIISVTILIFCVTYSSIMKVKIIDQLESTKNEENIYFYF